MRAPLLAATTWFFLAGGARACAQSQPAAPTSTAQPPAAPPSATPPPAVRYYEENGDRFRETRTTVRQPVREVRYVDQQRTWYQQRYRTDVQQLAYTTYVPVTQYECVARLHDWWRIFREPYVAYHLEPYTTWQPRTQTATVPTTRSEIVPYTQTVRVAVPQLRFADREQVSRVALGPASGSGSPRSLASEPVSDRVVLEPPPANSGGQPTFVPVPNRAPHVAAPLDPYNSRSFPHVTRPTANLPATRVPYRPVSPAPGPYGGVARLEGDPPRYGTTTSAGTWQARR